MSLFPELRSAFALLEHPTLRSTLRSYPEFGRLAASFSRQPPVDVHEEKGEDGKVKYVVEAELPGAKKEDVDIEFSEAGRTLVVTGKVLRSLPHAPDTNSSAEASTSAGDTTVAPVANKDVGRKIEGTTWHAQERSYGSFSRSVRFPVPVDVESATASYVDGVLKVTVGTKVEEQRRKVEIL